MPTAELKFYVDGALADVTSAALADPTATFGVKRNDTNAVVVASGTAMTHFATGVYRYTFTAPADGLVYTWYAKVVYNGATYYFQRTLDDSASTTQDLTTAARFKTFAGISGTTYDTLIGYLVTAASNAIREYCERDSFFAADYTEVYDGTGKWFLFLRNTPVNSIATVTMDYNESTTDPYDGDQFDFDPDTGEVRFKPTADSVRPFGYAGGFRSIRVAYNAGYDTIPATLEQACWEAVKVYYDRARVANSTLQSETIGDYKYVNANTVVTAASISTDPALDRVRTLLSAGGYYKPHFT